MFNLKVVFCALLLAVASTVAVPQFDYIESLDPYESVKTSSIELIEGQRLSNGNSFQIGHIHPSSFLSRA